MRRSLVVIIICLLLTQITAANESMCNLIIDLQDIDVEQPGQIIVNVYQNEATWNKPDKVYRSISISGLKKEIEVVIDSLKVNEYYAVQVIHDKNKNGKLDFRKFPFPRPKEGVGLSNNKFRMGPPRFEDAKILIDKQNVKITINMKY